MDYKEFFNTDNKSGWKCREDRLKSNYPKIYDEINNFINSNECLMELPFKTKIWHFINDVINIPKCLNCNNTLKFGRSLEEGYPIYCSIKCANKNSEHINKIKETNLHNHGVTCSLRIPEAILKSEKTMIEEYGVTNYFHLKDKIKEDRLNKLGIDHPMKLRTNIIKWDKASLINFGTNYYEKEIVSFIKNELNINIIENDRKIIKPYEIDVLLPDKRVGIEFNRQNESLTAKIPNNYHQMKSRLGIEKNVQIIHIFQDEWLFKCDIIKSMIKTKLGIFDKKIDIDGCIIKLITNKDKSNFLNANHIDGDSNCDIQLGVFYKKELILVCALLKNKGSIEITRFCHKLNYITTHAFKAILEYIKINFTTKVITSIVDLRYSNGHLYEKYGFKEIETIEPDYWFVEDIFRIDKNEVNDINLPKIYDCGKIRYKLIF